MRSTPFSYAHINLHANIINMRTYITTLIY